MDGRAVIRLYEPRDREAVREICCDTADAGEPMETFFPDREVLADLVTRYYTDYEPSCSWVAEQDGRVVGYLTGCLDTRQFLRVMTWRLGPVTFLKALVRGTLWHPQVVSLLRANLGGWLQGGLRRKIPLESYPAHLHINLRKRSRRRQIGRELMEKFFEQAARAGIHGIHANVSAKNERGRRFFESIGFTPVTGEERFGSTDQPPVARSIVYGKRL